MKSKTINIWDKFNFTEFKTKSAYSYLNDEKKNFELVAKGELTLDIEAHLRNTTSFENYAVYVLYIVAPKLGSYRKKLLTVEEDYNTGKFPVKIECNISEEKFENIDESQFISILQKIILHPLVKNSIEDLYKMSKSNK